VRPQTDGGGSLFVQVQRSRRRPASALRARVRRAVSDPGPRRPGRFAGRLPRRRLSGRRSRAPRSGARASSCPRLEGRSVGGRRPGGRAGLCVAGRLPRRRGSL